MSDQPSKSDQTLSEISHLFLSSLRERQTRGAPPPVRRPPTTNTSTEPAPLESDSANVDLTPEEVARVAGTANGVAVQAILASHLGASQLQRAKEYASHLAARGERVALIELDTSEFQLWTFERATGSSSSEGAVIPRETLDVRKMTQTLAELAHDIDRCLVLICSPRSSEARALLRQIPNWVLLASCEHEGIVAAYRTLKGMCELRHRNDLAPLPRLSMAVLDARDDVDASRVLEKLAGVSEHFLHWHIHPQGPVTKTIGVRPQLIFCGVVCDQAKTAQWKITSEFLGQLKTIQPKPVAAVHCNELDTDAVQLHGVAAPEGPTATSEGNVLDLPSSESSPREIVATVIKSNPHWVECPLRPPMAEHASLLVSRERRLVLIAAARQGLADLRSIAQAYRWLIDNRPLISMAMPQFSIDADQLPQLKLLVDHADMTADLLTPLLESRNVTVQAYRKLRWGAKTGLLLDAA